MLVDTHSHLFMDEFAADRSEVMQRAFDAGVERIYMPNVDLSTLEPLLRLCGQYSDKCFPLIGLHPTSITSSYYQEELTAIKRSLDEHPGLFVGIGEVGLDFYWDTTYAEEQMEVFEVQLHWALAYDLPLIIHCRNAFAELYDCMKPYIDSPLKGIFHCFTGDVTDAERFLQFQHFLFGVNGVVTYKKSPLPAMLHSMIPLDRLVLETDSPYLPPVPFRGKRNESSYIIYVAEKIAQVYDVSVEEVAQRTSRNAIHLFEGAKGACLGIKEF